MIRFGAGLVACIGLVGCSSSTLIQSLPSNAKLYINNEYVGTTPFMYRDSKINGSVTDIQIEKEGYAGLDATLYRNEEINGAAAVGGIVIWPLYLWVMEYKPTHTYQLKLLGANNLSEVNKSKGEKSKEEYTEEIKSLRDAGIISNEDFTLYLKQLQNGEQYNIVSEGVLSYAKMKAKNCVASSDLEGFKKSVSQNQISLIQIEKINSLLVNFDKKIVDQAQFLKDLHEVIWGTTLMINDNVTFTLREKAYAGKILKIENGKATVQYTEKYLLRDAVETIDLPFNELKYQ